MKRAFTLIELLVVIAIIAILAAILFPVFTQAKESAKKSVCMSNTKQMNLSLLMYAGDHEDTAPQTSWEASTTYPKQVHWTFLLQPYIKNYGIFRCSSDSNPVKPATACPTLADLGKLPMVCDWQAPAYSYIPNYNVLPAHDWLPVALTTFNDPANTIMVTERRDKLANASIGAHKGLSGFNPSQPCPGTTYAKITETQAYAHLTDTNDKFDIVRVKWDRHSGTANYCYVDGHAKASALGKTLKSDAYQYGESFFPAPWQGQCP